MTTRRACNLLASLALCALACDPQHVIVGETLPAGDTGDTGDTATDTDAPTTSDDPSSGSQDPSVTTTGALDGTQCAMEADYSLGPLIAEGSECEGDICLYAAGIAAPNCKTDGECTALGPYFSGCDGQRCVIAPAFAVAATTCTSACASDVDCPDVAGCETGRVCTPISILGPHCCQSVCACRDFLDDAFITQRALDCASGTYCQ